MRVANGVVTVAHSPQVRERVTLLIDQLCVAMGLPVPASRERAAIEAQRLRVGADAALTIDVMYDVADLVAAVDKARATQMSGAAPGQASSGQTSTNQSMPSQAKPGAARAAIANLIASSVDPPSWNPIGEGELHMFGPLLVVRQTSVNHIQIAAALAALREGFGLSPRPIPMSTEARLAFDALIARERQRAAAIERLGTLRQRLDDLLFARVVEAENPGADLLDRAVVTSRLGGQSLSPPDGDVIVSVLLRMPVNGATLREVAGNGFAIESRQDRLGMVVGRIDVRRLADLALVDGVRRVEMVGGRTN